MVLQQPNAKIWGKADAGEKVSVSIAGKTATATAAEDGSWSVRFTKLKSGGPHELVIQGKNKLVHSNVLIGDVWLCSGQSNMEWSVGSSKDADTEKAAATDDAIRCFIVSRSVSDSPALTTSGSWIVVSPETVSRTTAAGYFFAREVRKKVKMPIGLLQSAYGGSPAEAWMSAATLSENPVFAEILTVWQKKVGEYPAAKQTYDAALAQWKTESETAKAEGRPSPMRPTEPQGPGNRHQPSGLFNGMIAPLESVSLRGILWYQGEANVGRPYEYAPLFSTLIKSWRSFLKQGDLPFYFVQLAGFGNDLPNSTDSFRALLREAQQSALKLPNTGMATAVDIGEASDIHPKNKQEVGRRLALLALTKSYGLELAASGPTFSDIKTERNKLRITFKNATGLADKNEAPLEGFFVSGTDTTYYPAEAKIEGSTVVLTSPEVTKPIAARYAWGEAPACDLTNKTGLPALPFRTDAWDKTMPRLIPTPAPATPASESSTPPTTEQPSPNS